MAKKLNIFVGTAAILLMCVLSSFFTTKFLGMQQFVKEGTVHFQDKPNSDSTTVGGGGGGGDDNDSATTVQNEKRNASASASISQDVVAVAVVEQPSSKALPNKRINGTTTVSTAPALALATVPVSRTDITKHSVRHSNSNVSARIQNTTIIVPAATATITTATVPAPTITTATTAPATTTATAATNVITWQGVEDMNTFITRYWKGNYFCDTMEARNGTHHKQRPTLLNITFGCQDLFSKSGLGTGNFISAFYGLRLAASVFGDVNVQMTCPDAVQEQTSLILPWLMGSFPLSASRDSVKTSSGGIRGSSSHTSIRKNATSPPTIQQACGDYDKCPIGHMVPSIRYELRRMAVALVGIPHENHPAAAFADRYLWNTLWNNPYDTMQLAVPARGEPPLIPGVVLDDVVLHFRGGDLFNSNHPGFGFMKFSAFSKHISPDTKSIGIVTQPFDTSGQYRKGDATAVKRERHRIVVMALVDFLEEKFPQARVTIHNGRSETIALAYARMVMANQTVVGITSFGVFPAIACFGTGYIRKPDFKKGPNKFLINPPIDQLADNVILIEEPNRLMAGTVRAMFKRPTGQELVLEWFKNDTYCNGLPCY
jgi:hypothetical protein